MSKQEIQLEIMAQGGFDIYTDREDVMPDYDNLDSLDPESIILLREKIEMYLDNPCTSCRFNESLDPHVLDFCHYTCKDADIEPILLDEQSS